MSSIAGRSARSESRTPKAVSERTRSASQDRLERAVDPDGLLSPEERAWRAEQLRALRRLSRFSRRTGVA